MIEPRRDAYGPEADTSNLADYLELLALAETPLRRAELADYLEDQQWGIRSSELFHDPSAEEGDPEEEDPTAGAGVARADDITNSVFALLRRRADELGDRYPFSLDDSQVVLKGPVSDMHRPYLCLLAITVAHHYQVSTPFLPERMFEQLVAEVMGGRGLLTINTADASRQGGRFENLLERAGSALELISAPNAAVYRTHANEEGVDTVSHFSWGDTRAGHWVFIGQATCAQSNQWTKKITEPSPYHWGSWLSCVIQPIAYLAVPHHVEDSHLLYLSERETRMVLDRLRLTRHFNALSSDHRTLIDTVISAGVFHPLL